MHGRYRRASLCVTILLIIAVPAISTARPKDDLQRTRKKLRAVRNDLQADESKAHTLKQRIRAIGHDITSAQIQINQLDSRIARIGSEVRSAEARIRSAQAEIDEIRRVATEQAVDLYKSGSSETLSALLDARSIGELNDRIEMLGVAAQDNTAALVRYGRLRVGIEAQNRLLLARKEQLSSTRSEQAEALATRNELRSTLSRALTELNRTIGRTKTREGHLEDAAAALEEKLLAAQAKSSVTSLGISSRGFIWPLNGPVTSPFGSRWGSMHTGIDIDGYTGQPVVAAKAGNVFYLGAGMTGYGNAVVIDHGGGLSTLYAHLSGYAVSGGQGVEQGQIVGYVGCTGNCYGDHLHFEIRMAGNPVNPLDFLP